MLLLVGDFDDQNAVLADQTDQRHQAHLSVDIQGGTVDAERNEYQRAGNRQGHRNENHQGVAETFEQRRERQEYDNDGKAESAEDAGGLLYVLPQLSGVVDRVALRQG